MTPPVLPQYTINDPQNISDPQNTNVTGVSSTDPNDTCTFSIDFLCKLIPHDFNGNRYEVGQFIANCNNANELASTAQKIPLLYYILAKISGRAKEQLACQTFANWDSLKEKLKDLYQDKKHYAQIMEELNNCKQNYNESVHDFFQRLEILNARALSAVKLNTQDQSLIKGKIQAIEEITLNRFIFHSLPEMSQMLRWKDFNNLNSAFTAAISEERALNMNNNFRKRNLKFCKNCKLNNHNTSDCRSQYRNSNSHKSINILKNDNLGNNQNKGYNKSCKYCKKLGHVIEECRKLQFKNKLKEQQGNQITNPKLNLQTKSVHLNSQHSPVINTPLEDQISQLRVFEN